MKFGIFYEHQLPQPWDEGAELRLYQDALDQVRAVAKERELAPFIEAALARKPRLPPVEDAQIPRVEAFGRKAPSPLAGGDRGGGISIPTADPLAVR